MSTPAAKPTRRDERRAQTVREIKELAMKQISAGGPDAVSLSGIVREMSMSPAAVYRYFANRDALLADLVVDAYNELADALVAIEQATGSAHDHLIAVLHGSRTWAVEHPNAYRLIFQTSVGSGKDFAVERTVPAASRSMAVIVEALDAVTTRDNRVVPLESPARRLPMSEAITEWAERSGLAQYSESVLMLAVLSWTRLHGIISLELGGHLAATGIDAALLFETEAATLCRQASALQTARPESIEPIEPIEPK
ncbi:MULTISPECIES: TetR/AcrR family transcriptional regulator [Subtercola]|nr:MULTISPECIES: TetR/AcrR family transcriptional regulator [Subtercola]MEA9984731.1 TetR/AcrR family transcriptional regulator [Subtercola sp. RTI3]